MRIKQSIDRRQINFAVQKVATEITKDFSWPFGSRNPLLICVLNSAARFCMDIVDHLSSCVDGISFDVAFLAIESYHGTIRNKNMKLLMDIDQNIIENRHIILVDDIYDTGITLNWLKEHLQHKNPRSIKTCVLIEKYKKKVFNLDINYCGFNDVNDKFLVGYGMDYNGKYRGLPYIGELIDESCQV